MGEFRILAVSALEPPDEPDRQVSIMEDMDELVADIKAHGLLNPICVEDLEDGRYRVFAGHRRSIAVTILQWPEVACHVFGKDDPAIERMKASENLKRNQLNEVEEALVYRRVHEREGKQPREIAMYYGVNVTRVSELIDLSFGDERVFRLLGQKEISRAQALEINKFKTETYRILAIEQAQKHGLKAPGLRRWRQDIERQGGEQTVHDAAMILHSIAPAPAAEPMMVCQIANHATPLRLTKMYTICSDCWDIFVRGVEALRREEERLNGGTGDTGRVDQRG